MNINSQIQAASQSSQNKQADKPECIATYEITVQLIRLLLSVFFPLHIVGLSICGYTRNKLNSPIQLTLCSVIHVLQWGSLGSPVNVLHVGSAHQGPDHHSILLCTLGTENVTDINSEGLRHLSIIADLFRNTQTCDICCLV